MQQSSWQQQPQEASLAEQIAELQKKVAAAPDAPQPPLQNAVADNSDTMIFDIMDIPDLPSIPAFPPSAAAVSVKAAVKQANLKDASAAAAPPAPRPAVQRRPSIGAQGQTSR